MLAWVTVLASCTDVRDQPVATVANGCIGCHGDSDSLAPLDAVHQAHVHASTLFEAVDCSVCHIVPERASDEGHADTEPPAEVIFAPVAFAPDAPAPSYDPTTRSCANVACHGAALKAPADRPLLWDPPEPSNFYCAGCHDAPRTAGHPTVIEAAPLSCEGCHGQVLATSHVDGELDLALPTDCSACHGDATSPAPVDLMHRAHVLGSDHGRAVECSECHVVPEATGDAGHLDAAPAELTFGPLASTSAAPAWDGESCSSTYCHSGAAGGATPVPEWAETTELDCGSCHGAPPPAPHPAMDACSLCHGDSVDDDLAILDPATHIDGTVDQTMPTDCGGCHGSPGSPAPLDSGHDTHLGSAASAAAPMDCSTCHIVPAEPLDPGHLDGPPAEVTFGGPALLDGSSPVFADSSCSSSYCHGSSTPTWGDTSGTWSSCDACHGAPPPPPHLPNDRCDACHSNVVEFGPLIHAPELHIDGAIQTVTPACNACHGDATTDAPDQGAHLTHVAFGFDCTECHVVPAAYTDAAHLDGAPGAEVEFGALANTGQHTSQWNVEEASCSSTYCHSNTGTGNVAVPEWDATDGAAGQCGGCHALPPATTDAHNDTSLSCILCHKAYPDKHVNGLIDFIP